MKLLNIVYFVITALVIVWILYNRKASKPSALNLRAATKGLPDLIKPIKPSDREKNLDCLFMYNGHEFNAYEVLGIPAGTSLQVAEVAFTELQKNSKIEHDFYQAALEAIRKSV